MARGRGLGFLLAYIVAGAPAALADGDAKVMSLREAVEYALARSPRVREIEAARSVAEGKADAARAGLLPDLSLVAEVDRGTGNVVPGSLFSLRGIPAVSGPPRGRTFDSGAFGSSVGASASWDVLLLKRQMAVVDAGMAEGRRAAAAIDAVKLDVAFEAGDRFIAAVSRGEVVRAAEAGVTRSRVLVEIVKALVDQALRPGADLSRAQAELAIAEVQLARSKEGEAVARIELARALGEPRLNPIPEAGRLVEVSPLTLPTASLPHPAVVESQATVNAADKRQQAVGLEYLPRVELAGALWLRGSGYFPQTDGTPAPGRGLVPDTPNWTAGVVFTWPILDLVGVRARARAESGNVRAATARQELITQLIDAQMLSASAVAQAARRISAETPVAIAAARAAETQAMARYRSGLAAVLEVAEAQRLLTDAEIQDAEARLGVWSALLLASRAAGDLGPFLQAASGTGGR